MKNFLKIIKTTLREERIVNLSNKKFTKQIPKDPNKILDTFDKIVKPNESNYLEEIQKDVPKK